jgi:class 3 adenylate cyclase/CheY-like chemotaxis protein
VLALGGYIAHRSSDMVRFACDSGHPGLVPDLDQLRAVAEGLLPLAEELRTDHESLTAEAEPVAAPRPPLDAPSSARTSPDVDSSAPLLIVDDNEGNRDLLARRLRRTGYTTLAIATNGREALGALAQREFDLVLLDVMMPELDGVGVLRAMKADARLRDIPVIMISAVDDVSSVAQCIELGAEDYLPKPFDPMVLQARIRSSLDRKRLRDRDKQRTIDLERALRDVDKARQDAEHLLHNIIPDTVAEELREKNAVDPMYFEDVTIVFTDFVAFTLATQRLSAEELVHLLHSYFSGIDRITERYGMEKLKTIGDAYMFVGGMPIRNPAHPVDAVLAAFEIVDFVGGMKGSGNGAEWSIRVGVHTGPVIAGVVGVNKFAFDIWGETVNIASRMQSAGKPDQITLSERTYSRVKDFFQCERRGKATTKEGIELEVYVPTSVQPKLLAGMGSPPEAFAKRYKTYFGRVPQAFPASLVAPT